MPRTTNTTAKPMPSISARTRSVLLKSLTLTRGSRTNRPVLDDQPGDASKLSRVVGNQRQALATGVSSDEQVVRPNHRTQPFQVSAYAGVVRRCLVGKIQDLDVIQKGV